MTTGAEPASRRRTRAGRAAAYFFVGFGSLLAAAGIAYLVWAQVARSRLDELEYSVPETVQDGWLRPAPLEAAPASGGEGAETASARREPALPASQEPEGPATGAPPSGGAADAPRFDFASVYPADQTNPKFWDRPDLAGTGPYGGPGLPDGYEFVSRFDIFRAAGGLETANRIAIPAIEVDAAVKELEIIDLGDSRSYETPDNVVGHIPGTPNPGEGGNGWFFGHLESPLRGEGNVFQRLPEIEELVRQDPVDIIIENDDGGFLYRVVATSVVHEDDLALYGSDGAELTLVACVPTRVYDHRLLVTAELIARRG